MIVILPFLSPKTKLKTMVCTDEMALRCRMCKYNSIILEIFKKQKELTQL